MLGGGAPSRGGRGLGMQANIGETERINPCTDDIGINARINQRSQRHITADTGGAIEVSNFHGSFLEGLELLFLSLTICPDYSQDNDITIITDAVQLFSRRACPACRPDTVFF